MTDDAYEQLAAALDKLPNGFPRTPSNVEILPLKKIFSPEEAPLASKLCGDMEPSDMITERVRLSVEKVQTKLMKMAKRGLVWFDKQAEKPQFRLAPSLSASTKHSWRTWITNSHTFSKTTWRTEEQLEL